MANERFQECIEACQECVVACEHCATACLQEQHVSEMTRCISLDLSCADFCSLAVRELSRGSEFAERVCQLCAEICDACGEECARHDMDHCQLCAEACRDCADACRQMAHSHAG